jgi:FtsZ-binding cell division protein ZapB
MISLSQVQLLEQKVESAILKINALTEENRNLREKFVSISAEHRSIKEKMDDLELENLSLQDKCANVMAERDAFHEKCAAAETANMSLQAKIDEFQANQSRIEQGILNALHKLDSVENTIIETVGFDEADIEAADLLPEEENAAPDPPATNDAAEAEKNSEMEFDIF